MYIFAFNLYTQINLFIKHIFTNKFITIPYYIYTDRWSAPRCLVVILVPGGGPRGVGGIYANNTQAGTPRGSSARRAVLLLNQSFGVKFKDAIALIINYLGAPLGWAFTGLHFS